MKSEQLLTQGKIFEEEILAGPECTNNPAEDVSEPYDHAQNLTGTLPIELGAKSLILRVYDVLMNDSLQNRPGTLLFHTPECCDASDWGAQQRPALGENQKAPHLSSCQSCSELQP